MQNTKLICQQTWLSQHKYALMIQLATLLTTAEKRQRVLHWGLTDALFQTSWITANWVQAIYRCSAQSSMNHQILQPHWFYSKQHKMFHRSTAGSILMEGITGSAVGYLALCEVLTTLDHKCSSWVKLSLITWQSTYPIQLIGFDHSKNICKTEHFQQHNRGRLHFITSTAISQGDWPVKRIQPDWYISWLILLADIGKMTDKNMGIGIMLFDMGPYEKLLFWEYNTKKDAWGNL